MAFIYRFDGSILFVNADKFIEELYKQTVHPLRLQTQTKTGVVRKESSNVSSFGRHKTNICGKEIDIGTFTMKDINSTSRDPTGMEHYVLENQTSNEEKIANVDTEIKIMKEKQVRTIVLDLTKASIIDAMGVNSLKKIWTAYRSVGIELVAAGCSKDVIKKLVAAGLVEKFHRQDECNSELATMKLYPSVHDAVVASR